MLCVNLVGDADGVIIIPAHLAAKITAEATSMTAFDDLVLEQVRAGCSIRGLYPPTDPATLSDFADWQKKT